MTDARMITGGCLCGQLRYTASGAPAYAGYCCCADCRKASGSGFIPFIGFAASALRITGEARQSRTASFRGTEAVRNHCATCGALVFGGEYGRDGEHTLYAGTLDDPAHFQPTIALFVRDKPDWVVLPDGLQTFETMPE